MRGGSHGETGCSEALTGEFDAEDAESLLEQYRQMADRAHIRATINVSALVPTGHRRGLAGLRQLQRGHRGVQTRVTGARWSQFLVLPQATPIQLFPDTPGEIRIVLGHDGGGQVTRSPNRLSTGRHRRCRDAAPGAAAGRSGLERTSAVSSLTALVDDSSWRAGQTR